MQNHKFKRLRRWGVPVLFLALLPITPNAIAEDLKEIYALAKSYDSTIQAAEHDYDAALQNLPLAKSTFKPQLNASLNAGLTELNDDGQSAYYDTTLALSLRQSLYNKPNSATITQAELGVKQAEAQLLAQQQSLILRTANAYFNVLRAQVDVDFSRSELQAIARQREQAERRFDVGLVPVTDVRSAQAQYDLAVASEIAAQNSLENAREAMLTITGSSPELLSTLARDLPLEAPTPADADQWVNMALEQNLELVATRLAAETASSNIDTVRGARSPTIDLVGVVQSSTTDQSGRSDTESGEVRLELSMPIYTGGRIQAQVGQARSEYLSAEQSLANTERTTAQQTRDAYRGVTVSISRAKALRQALVSTRKSAEATEAGFKAGTRTSVEVLQALRDVYGAESDYASARYDYIINYLTLKSAAGTLNEDDLNPINSFLIDPATN